MIFSEILSAAYDETGYASSPAATIVTRFKRWANEGVRAIVFEPGLMRLLDSDSPATFASVASQARYTLPESVARILKVTERTSDIPLEVMSLDRYRAIEPDPTSNTGTPTHVVPIGRVAVATQPSDASSIFVKSDNAGDTTQTVYIEGTITGGYTRTASVSLNGTTAANLSSAISTFIEITDFYLSAAAVGTVTLLEDSGSGTELARVTIGALRPRYSGVYLWPTPSAAVTYYVDYQRELVELVNSADEPPLPTNAHPAIVAYIVMRERELKEDTTREIVAQRRYQQFLSDLKYSLTLGSELPVGGRRAWMGHSRLGANYPADTWRPV